jgi:hypothetical protein
MNFTEQDRSGAVTPPRSEGLSRWAQRCFAALSMTLKDDKKAVIRFSPLVVGEADHGLCSRDIIRAML